MPGKSMMLPVWHWFSPGSNEYFVNHIMTNPRPWVDYSLYDAMPDPAGCVRAEEGWDAIPADAPADAHRASLLHAHRPRAVGGGKEGSVGGSGSGCPMRHRQHAGGIHAARRPRSSGTGGGKCPYAALHKMQQQKQQQQAGGKLQAKDGGAGSSGKRDVIAEKAAAGASFLQESAHKSAAELRTHLEKGSGVGGNSGEGGHIAPAGKREDGGRGFMAQAAQPPPPHAGEAASSPSTDSANAVPTPRQEHPDGSGSRSVGGESAALWHDDHAVEEAEPACTKARRASGSTLFQQQHTASAADSGGRGSGGGPTSSSAVAATEARNDTSRGQGSQGRHSLLQQLQAAYRDFTSLGCRARARQAARTAGPGGSQAIA